MIDDEETLAGVREAFELPRLEEALPTAFREAHGLSTPRQYGIVCKQVRACVREAEALGAGPFFYARVRPPNWTERGKRLYDTQLEVAIGYAGETQVELLGPGRGTRFYSEVLGDRDVALHHVGVFQGGVAATARSLEAARHPLAARGGVHVGPLLSFDFRYFDTRDALGQYLEVLDFTYFGSRPLDLAPWIKRWAAREARRRAG